MDTIDNTTIVAPSLFFCAGAWSTSFHIGVYKAIVEKWGYNNISKVLIGGNSGGAFVALAIVLGYTWEELESCYLEISEQSEKLGIYRKITEYHNIMINKFIKNENDYIKANKRLHIGVTYFLNEYELISEWNNNEELINTLHASFHIPFYCSYINKVKKRNAIDGSFGKFFHKFDNNTIIIDSISDVGDIICNPPLNLSCFYKPNNLTIYKYINNKGYDAFKNWDNIYKKSPNSSRGNIFMFFIWILRYLEYLRF